MNRRGRGVVPGDSSSKWSSPGSSARQRVDDRGRGFQGCGLLNRDLDIDEFSSMDSDSDDYDTYPLFKQGSNLHKSRATDDVDGVPIKFSARQTTSREMSTISGDRSFSPQESAGVSTRKDLWGTVHTTSAGVKGNLAYSNVRERGLKGTNSVHASSKWIGDEAIKNLESFIAKQGLGNVETNDVLEKAKLAAIEELLKQVAEKQVSKEKSSIRQPNKYRTKFSFTPNIDSFCSDSSYRERISEQRKEPPKPAVTSLAPETSIPVVCYPQSSTSSSSVDHVMKKLAPDGSGAVKYPAPNPDLMKFDATSGYRYDSTSGLHYDANSGYFFNSYLQIFLYWDMFTQTYLRVQNVDIPIPLALAVPSHGNFPNKNSQLALDQTLPSSSILDSLRVKQLIEQCGAGEHMNFGTATESELRSTGLRSSSREKSQSRSPSPHRRRRPLRSSSSRERSRSRRSSPRWRRRPLRSPSPTKRNLSRSPSPRWSRRPLRSPSPTKRNLSRSPSPHWSRRPLRSPSPTKRSRPKSPSLHRRRRPSTPSSRRRRSPPKVKRRRRSSPESLSPRRQRSRSQSVDRTCRKDNKIHEKETRPSFHENSAKKMKFSGSKGSTKQDPKLKIKTYTGGPNAEQTVKLKVPCRTPDVKSSTGNKAAVGYRIIKRSKIPVQAEETKNDGDGKKLSETANKVSEGKQTAVLPITACDMNRKYIVKSDIYLVKPGKGDLSRRLIEPANKPVDVSMSTAFFPKNPTEIVLLRPYDLEENFIVPMTLKSLQDILKSDSIPFERIKITKGNDCGAPYDFLQVFFADHIKASLWLNKRKGTVDLRMSFKPSGVITFDLYYSEENWSCRHCNQSNFAWRSICFGCFVHKSGAFTNLKFVNTPTQMIGIYKMGFSPSPASVIKIAQLNRFSVNSLRFMQDPAMECCSGLCVLEMKDVAEAIKLTTLLLSTHSMLVSRMCSYVEMDIEPSGSTVVSSGVVSCKPTHVDECTPFNGVPDLRTSEITPLKPQIAETPKAEAEANLHDRGKIYLKANSYALIFAGMDLKSRIQRKPDGMDDFINNYFTNDPMAHLLVEEPADVVLVKPPSSLKIIDLDFARDKLEEYLRISEAKYQLIIKARGGECGAPYDHLQVIFKCAADAEVWFKQRKGVINWKHIQPSNIDSFFTLHYSKRNWICNNCNQLNFSLRALCFGCCAHASGENTTVKLVEEPTTMVGVYKILSYLQIHSESLPLSLVKSVQMVQDPLMNRFCGLCIFEMTDIEGAMKLFTALESLKLHCSYILTECELISVSDTLNVVSDGITRDKAGKIIVDVITFELSPERVNLKFKIPDSETHKFKDKPQPLPLNDTPNKVILLIPPKSSSNFNLEFAEHNVFEKLRMHQAVFSSIIVSKAVACGAPHDCLAVVFHNTEDAIKWFDKCGGKINLKYGTRPGYMEFTLHYSELNWACIKCGSLNFPLRGFCFNCFAFKNGECTTVRLVKEPTSMVGIYYLGASGVAAIKMIIKKPSLENCFFIKSVKMINDPVMKRFSGLCVLETTTAQESIKLMNILKNIPKRFFPYAYSYVFSDSEQAQISPQNVDTIPRKLTKSGEAAAEIIFDQSNQKNIVNPSQKLDVASIQKIDFKSANSRPTSKVLARPSDKSQKTLVETPDNSLNKKDYDQKDSKEDENLNTEDAKEQGNNFEVITKLLRNIPSSNVVEMSDEPEVASDKSIDDKETGKMKVMVSGQNQTSSLGKSCGEPILKTLVETLNNSFIKKDYDQKDSKEYMNLKAEEAKEQGNNFEVIAQLLRNIPSSNVVTLLPKPDEKNFSFELTEGPLRDLLKQDNIGFEQIIQGTGSHCGAPFDHLQVVFKSSQDATTWVTKHNGVVSLICSKRRSDDTLLLFHLYYSEINWQCGICSKTNFSLRALCYNCCAHKSGSYKSVRLVKGLRIMVGIYKLGFSKVAIERKIGWISERHCVRSVRVVSDEGMQIPSGLVVIELKSLLQAKQLFTGLKNGKEFPKFSYIEMSDDPGIAGPSDQSIDDKDTGKMKVIVSGQNQTSSLGRSCGEPTQRKFGTPNNSLIKIDYDQIGSKEDMNLIAEEAKEQGNNFEVIAQLLRSIPSSNVVTLLPKPDEQNFSCELTEGPLRDLLKQDGMDFEQIILGKGSHCGAPFDHLQVVFKSSQDASTWVTKHDGAVSLTCSECRNDDSLLLFHLYYSEMNWQCRICSNTNFSLRALCYNCCAHESGSYKSVRLVKGLRIMVGIYKLEFSKVAIERKISWISERHCVRSVRVVFDEGMKIPSGLVVIELKSLLQAKQLYTGLKFDNEFPNFSYIEMSDEPGMAHPSDELIDDNETGKMEVMVSRQNQTSSLGKSCSEPSQRKFGTPDISFITKDYDQKDSKEDTNLNAEEAKEQGNNFEVIAQLLRNISSSNVVTLLPKPDEQNFSCELTEEPLRDLLKQDGMGFEQIILGKGSHCGAPFDHIQLVFKSSQDATTWVTKHNGAVSLTCSERRNDDSLLLFHLYYSEINWQCRICSNTNFSLRALCYNCCAHKSGSYKSVRLVKGLRIMVGIYKLGFSKVAIERKISWISERHCVRSVRVVFDEGMKIPSGLVVIELKSLLQAKQLYTGLKFDNEFPNFSYIEMCDEPGIARPSDELIDENDTGKMKVIVCRQNQTSSLGKSCSEPSLRKFGTPDISFITKDYDQKDSQGDMNLSAEEAKDQGSIIEADIEMVDDPLTIIVDECGDSGQSDVEEAKVVAKRGAQVDSKNVAGKIIESIIENEVKATTCGVPSKSTRIIEKKKQADSSRGIVKGLGRSKLPTQLHCREQSGQNEENASSSVRAQPGTSDERSSISQRDSSKRIYFEREAENDVLELTDEIRMSHKNNYELITQWLRKIPSSNVVILQPDSGRQHFLCDPAAASLQSLLTIGGVDFEEIIVGKSTSCGSPFDHLQVVFKDSQDATRWIAKQKGRVFLDCTPGSDDEKLFYLHYSKINWVCKLCSERNFSFRALCYNCCAHKSGAYTSVRLVKKASKFVGLYKLGFSESTVERKIRFILEKNTVKSVHIISDPDMKLCSGFCVLEMKNLTEAKNLISDLRTGPRIFHSFSYVEMDHAPLTNAEIQTPHPDTGSHKRVLDLREVLNQSPHNSTSRSSQSIHGDNERLMDPRGVSISPPRRHVETEYDDYRYEGVRTRRTRCPADLRYVDDEDHHVIDYRDEPDSSFHSLSVRDRLDDGIRSQRPVDSHHYDYDELRHYRRSRSHSPVYTSHRILAANRHRSRRHDPDIDTERAMLSRRSISLSSSGSDGTFPDPLSTSVRPPRPDGLSTFRYPMPDPETFLHHERSGFYYDPYTTLYFDSSRNLFYNDDLDVYLMFQSGLYIQVEPHL